VYFANGQTDRILVPYGIYHWFIQYIWKSPIFCPNISIGTPYKSFVILFTKDSKSLQKKKKSAKKVCNFISVRFSFGGVRTSVKNEVATAAAAAAAAAANLATLFPQASTCGASV
jgi:hypothetical protein